MAKAQEKLDADLKADPTLRDRLDVENVEEGDQKVVEMNLGWPWFAPIGFGIALLLGYLLANPASRTETSSK